MTNRLVLGSSPVLFRIVEGLAELPGSVRVGTTEEGLADSIHDLGVTVSLFEQFDEETLRELDTPDIVAVFEEARQANLDRCRAVNAVFPDAYLLAYTGRDAGDEGEIEQIADQVLDPASATASSSSRSSAVAALATFSSTTAETSSPSNSSRS